MVERLKAQKQNIAIAGQKCESLRTVDTGRDSTESVPSKINQTAIEVNKELDSALQNVNYCQYNVQLTSNFLDF